MLILLLCLVNKTKATELDSLKIWAAENHPQLKSAYKSYEAALENVYGQAFLPDPMFSFGYFISPVQTRVGPQLASFGLQQMLPWLGTLNASKNIAAENAKMKFEQFNLLKIKLYKDVELLYYEAENLHFVKKFTEENIVLLKRIKEQALLNVSVGKASSVDVLRIELEINELQTLKETLKINLKSKKEVLVLKCGKEDISLDFRSEKDFNLEDLIRDKFDNSDSDSLPKELKLHPSLSVINHQLSINEFNEVTLKQKSLPKVGVGINYTMVGKRTDVNIADNGRDILIPNLSISLPIYRKKYNSQVKVNLMERDKIELDYEAATLQLEELKVVAVSSKLSAIEKAKLYKKQTNAVLEILQILINDYENGNATIESVLTTQKQLINFKIKTQEAITEIQKADAELKFIYNQNY